jgi:hypothetical protein
MFRLKPDTSNSHEFELHRPSNKGTKLLLKVIKAIIIIIELQNPQISRRMREMLACVASWWHGGWWRGGVVAWWPDHTSYLLDGHP